MNHDEREPDDHTVPGQREIDALLDGEPVDKEALRAALADADARDYLIDTLALRQMTREMGPAHFVPAAPTSRGLRQVRWIAAAFVLMTSAAGGYVYGQRTMVATDGGATYPTSDGARATAENGGPPPAPTSVIRFVPGVNWTNPEWSR